MRIAAIVALAGVLVAACSQQAPASTFSVPAATVDATHWCPGGAKNAAYEFHAKIDARNDTAQAVAVDSATASMVLVAVSGPWLEPVGDTYDAGTVQVTPATVPAHSRATLDVTIPSACTSGLYGAGTSSSAQYRVTVRLETTAGVFSVTASNRHEIRAA